MWDINSTFEDQTCFFEFLLMVQKWVFPIIWNGDMVHNEMNENGKWDVHFSRWYDFWSTGFWVMNPLKRVCMHLCRRCYRMEDITDENQLINIITKIRADSFSQIFCLAEQRYSRESYKCVLVFENYYRHVTNHAVSAYLLLIFYLYENHIAPYKMSCRLNHDFLWHRKCYDQGR